MGFILLIFAAYYVNSTMFYHGHIVDGDVIYHSHFYSKFHTTSSEDGGHSIEVIRLIATLNSISFEQQELSHHLEDVERPLEVELRAAKSSKAMGTNQRYFSLRAPPRL